jgi:hypothetical protein
VRKPYVIRSRGLFKCGSDKPFKVSRSQIEAYFFEPLSLPSGVSSSNGT